MHWPLLFLCVLFHLRSNTIIITPTIRMSTLLRFCRRTIQNLMLRDAGDIGSLVVADLGLGTKVKVDETGFPTERCGTLEFMAPESWLEDRIKTYKVDLFSCGMTLLHFLVGTENFKDIANGRTRNKVTGAFFTREELEEELDLIIYVPPQMINLLDGLTKPDPNERLSTEEWLHHPALQDVPNPLEVAEDVPTSDASSLPQDNVEQLKKNLEAANQRAADAEEKAVNLQAKYDDLKEKLDAANEESEKTAKLEAELSDLKKKVGEQNDAPKQALEVEEQFAEMHLDVAADFHVSIATIKKLQGDIDTLASFLMKSSSPLSFVQFTKIFDKESSTSFLDTFFDEYPGDDSKFASLFAFAASFDCTWSHHQKQSAKAKKLLPVTSFLDCYAPAVSGMSNALKQGTTMGSKYCEVTKVEKDHFDALVKKSDKKNKRSSFDTARKQQWAQQAEAVGKDIGAKLTEAKIDDNKNFSSALATIERVVKVVFDERAALGVHLVPETYRHSISVLLAVVHITAGNEYEP